MGADVIAWNALPEQVRDTVQGHVGLVTTATDVTAGQNSDISAVLQRQDAAPVFLKGVHGVSPRMRWLRNETATAPLTRGLSPAVLFSEDVDGWLIVGFEHVTGRPASLAPGSPDLPIVAHAVNRIGTLPGAGLRPLRQRWAVTDWWRKLATETPDVIAGWDVDEAMAWAARFPALADGDRLVHTDLHGDQFLIRECTARVIDWGYPGAGAAWVDTAFVVLRLVEAGHAPGDAETWACNNLACFAGGEHLTAFVVHIAGLWGYWAVTGNIPGAQHRAQLARDYAAWRLAATPTSASH